jgi:hypothetical protein
LQNVKDFLLPIVLCEKSWTSRCAVSRRTRTPAHRAIGGIKKTSTAAIFAQGSDEGPHRTADLVPTSGGFFDFTPLL